MTSVWLFWNKFFFLQLHGNPDVSHSYLGLSAPAVTNPFQHEQPRLTLNQMRPSSTSPAPTSLQHSTPAPAVNQPLSLPSSFSQATEGHVNMPGNLPQPLLPYSSTSTPQHGQPDQSQNPFLWGLAWSDLRVAWITNAYSTQWDDLTADSGLNWNIVQFTRHYCFILANCFHNSLLLLLILLYPSALQNQCVFIIIKANSTSFLVFPLQDRDLISDQTSTLRHITATV